MARLQILELPTEHHGDDMVTPWLLVIDQVDDETAADIARWPDDIAKRTGARHVLCFTETIDIPVNETPVDPDGYPLKIRVEPDFETFREQVQDEIREAQVELARAINGDPPTDARAELTRSENAHDRLRSDRDDARMWARHGYEIGQRHCGWTDHGVAPDWLTEGWPNSFDTCEHLKKAAEYDEALTRVRAEVARIRSITPTWGPVADLIEAALNGTPNTRKSTGRPTHPDGTPYNHGEIVAGGWEHCDGCRTWGQWTTEKAHDCISSHAMDTAADA